MSGQPARPIARGRVSLRYEDGEPRLEVNGIVVDGVTRAVVVQDANPEALPAIIFYTLHPEGIDDLEFDLAELLDVREMKTTVYEANIRFQDAVQLMGVLCVEVAMAATHRAVGDDAPNPVTEFGYYTIIVNEVTERLNARRVIPSVEEADEVGASWLAAEHAERFAEANPENPTNAYLHELSGHVKRLNELLLGYSTRARPYATGIPTTTVPPIEGRPGEDPLDA